MKKYTAEEIRNERISFRDLTCEQYETLQEHFHKLYPYDTGMKQRRDFIQYIINKL